MGKIRLKNVKLYSNHGCLDQEELIGSDYVLQLEVSVDLNKSSKSDNLNDTVDYVALNSIIKEEALKRSKLLEAVAKRIIDRIFNEHASVKKAKVEISKINPPIGGDVEAVSIILKRKET
ncbi:MAG: dihydroneopterin aldolase [Candidatus Marivariicella framensis]|jgi:dihydroneopterin aldolase|tara:strand:- start:2914 stop:3273 length:360 start_codon:yes stop_codon:yes gene_type:complete